MLIESHSDLTVVCPLWPSNFRNAYIPPSLNLAFLCLTLGQSLKKTVPITLNDFNHRKSLCWRTRYLHPRNHSFYTGKFQGRFCGNCHWHQMILTEYSIRQVGPQKLYRYSGDWYLDIYLEGPERKRVGIGREETGLNK